MLRVAVPYRSYLEESFHRRSLLWYYFSDEGLAHTSDSFVCLSSSVAAREENGSLPFELDHRDAKTMVITH